MRLKARAPGKWRKTLRKMTEKQRSFPACTAAKTDCLIACDAYLDLHDGPFPLPEHLCGAARQLFRPGRPDAGRFAAADQAEPAAGGPPRPRSGPAWQPGGDRDPRRKTDSRRGGPDRDGL